jgi:hypothetical protein
MAKEPKNSEALYVLSHLRRKEPGFLEEVARYIFRADSHSQAITEAQYKITQTFDAASDYVPLWHGVDLIWECGTPA